MTENQHLRAWQILSRSELDIIVHLVRWYPHHTHGELEKYSKSPSNDKFPISPHEISELRLFCLYSNMLSSCTFCIFQVEIGAILLSTRCYHCVCRLLWLWSRKVYYWFAGFQLVQNCVESLSVRVSKRQSQKMSFLDEESESVWLSLGINFLLFSLIYIYDKISSFRPCWLQCLIE